MGANVSAMTRLVVPSASASLWWLIVVTDHASSGCFSSLPRSRLSLHGRPVTVDGMKVGTDRPGCICPWEAQQGCPCFSEFRWGR